MITGGLSCDCVEFGHFGGGGGGQMTPLTPTPPPPPSPLGYGPALCQDKAKYPELYGNEID